MNNVFRFPPGELRRRAAQRDLLQEIVFNAETDETRDLEVITLRQHLRDQAINAVWEPGFELVGSIDESIEHLLNGSFTEAKEFVEITQNRIKVGIDAAEVTDDIVDRALVLLLQVDDITKEQIVEFGETRRVYGLQH
jgi:hypothetical protein